MRKLEINSLILIALIFTSCGDSATKENTTVLKNAKLVSDEIADVGKDNATQVADKVFKDVKESVLPLEN